MTWCERIGTYDVRFSCGVAEPIAVRLEPRRRASEERRRGKKGRQNITRPATFLLSPSLFPSQAGVCNARHVNKIYNLPRDCSLTRLGKE